MIYEKGAFISLVTIFVGRLKAGEYTGEDIRIAMQRKGFYPKHHNAWGGAINMCIKELMLIPTARYRPMADPRSHSRSTRIYRRL